MPARHRELFAEYGGQLTITRHPRGYLMVYPRSVWQAFRERVAGLPEEASWWKRTWLGYATDVDIDTSGRVLVAPELRSAAGIGKDVMLLGMGSHLELWDAQTHAQKEAIAMQGGQADQVAVPECLKNFNY